MSILVDSHWLHARFADPTLVVLDATVVLPAPAFDGDYRVSSGEEGWLQAHIPGARHADLLTELADTQASFSFALPTPETLVSVLARLGAGQGKTLVIYDRADGFWAARLWWMLRSVGIDASVLDGGFNAPVPRRTLALPQRPRRTDNTRTTLGHPPASKPVDRPPRCRSHRQRPRTGRADLRPRCRAV